MTLTDPPIARNTDPWTSHASARAFIQSGGRDTAQKRIIQYFLENDGKWTATEIGQRLGMPGAHKRLPEVERNGWIERCEVRPCNVTGVKAATWRLIR